MQPYAPLNRAIRFQLMVLPGVTKQEIRTLARQVIHTGDRRKQLEAQRGIISQRARNPQQVLTPHMQRQLAAIEDNLADGFVEGLVGFLQG